MENKKYCSICGKEKEQKFIEFGEFRHYYSIECECEKQERLKLENAKKDEALATYLKKRTEASRILKREEGAFFDRLVVDEHNKKAVSAAKYIADLMLKGSEAQGKNGLVLLGNRGSGKTYIAASIINEYNKKEPVNESALNEVIKAHDKGFKNDVGFRIDSRCRFMKEREILSLYEKHRYKEEKSPIDEFKNAKILVVDDLGSTYGDSKRITSDLFDFFDYRYSQRLSTIITTNLSKEEFHRYLGERTIDRLNDCCHYVALTSPESRRGSFIK